MIEKLRNIFTTALVNAFGEEFANIDPLVVPASNPKFGDYQCNIALPLAKSLQQKPRAIAENIVNHAQTQDFCLPLEIAGPGFINITIKPEYIAEKNKIKPTR